MVAIAVYCKTKGALGGAHRGCSIKAVNSIGTSMERVRHSLRCHCISTEHIMDVFKALCNAHRGSARTAQRIANKIHTV